VAYCSLLQPSVGDWMEKGLEADGAAVGADNTAAGADDTTS